MKAAAGRWLAGLVLLPGVGLAQAPVLQNWFDDPFFQVSAARPDCPEPAGPRVTAAERQQQSHRRAEKGTTCWLAGEAGCERPNAFAYGRDIATAIRQALHGRRTLFWPAPRCGSRCRAGWSISRAAWQAPARPPSWKP